MEPTGQYIGSRWAGRVELLPGEFEVFSKSARRDHRAGRMIFTNQRLIWRPSFKPKVGERDMLVIALESITACEVVRPWQSFFLVKALQLLTQSGDTLVLYVQDPESILPKMREYMSRDRYKPGELFKSE
jgi:hypothetical protein